MVETQSSIVDVVDVVAPLAPCERCEKKTGTVMGSDNEYRCKWCGAKR